MYSKEFNINTGNVCNRSRLVQTFTDPMTEVYLLFFQGTVPTFTSFNLLLQREQSSIFLLHDEMVKFVRKLCSKFMVPAALQCHEEPCEIAFKEKANHLPGFPISSHTMGQRSMTFWVTGAKEFERLAAVAKLVLVFPHANADAERVFSVVGLNKTKRRNSQALDGTLSSIMTIKWPIWSPASNGSPPPISSRPPRRPQASITMPTDHRQEAHLR
ncbi:uncharacterized protein LOC121574295 [Coregonus clupeaformis]|uniref:uncharacterized protein LOC121574295 n=1 Tax=Coregonus clupeaformis TaxID=59861 RepID=UPI001E1C9C3A|nr:uncharacterized protein LOC121574295 [Coregonus clupeaformis]